MKNLEPRKKFKNNKLKDQAKILQKIYLVRYPDLSEDSKEGCYWKKLQPKFDLNSYQNAEFFYLLAQDLIELFNSVPNNKKKLIKLLTISLWDKFSIQETKYAIPFYAYPEKKKGKVSLSYKGVVNKTVDKNYWFSKFSKEDYEDLPNFVQNFIANRPIGEDKKPIDIWGFMHEEKHISIPILFTNDKKLIYDKKEKEKIEKLNFPVAKIYAPIDEIKISKSCKDYPKIFLPDPPPLDLYEEYDNKEKKLEDVWPNIEVKEEFRWKKSDEEEIQCASAYHAAVLNYIESYAGAINIEDQEDKKSYIFEIPITLEIIKKENKRAMYRTIANLSLTVKEMDMDSVNAINEIYSIMRSHLHEIISLPIKNRILYRVNQNARISAAAGILSRNWSHNIGSHVMINLKVDTILSRYKTLYETKSLKATEFLEVLTTVKSLMDDYNQRKAEFIADMTTEPLLSIRSAFFFSEVMVPFIENTGLIDNLAASEGFGYKTFEDCSLKIHCFGQGRDESIVPYPLVYVNATDKSKEIKTDNAPYALKFKDTDDLYQKRDNVFLNYMHENNNKQAPRDHLLGLPGPAGEMAIYSFLENYIRNAAKHGRPKENEDSLEIGITIKIKDEDFYCIEIYDNRHYPGEKLSQTKKKIEDYLREDIIDKQGERRKKAWGIAEMSLCGQLLRGNKDFSEPGGGKLKIIYGKWNPASKTPAVVASKEESNCIIYRMPVMRAKEAILIGFEPPFDEDDYSKKGIKFLPNKEDLDTLGSGNYDKSASPVAFQFAVIDSGIFEDNLDLSKWLDQKTQLLPFRVIIVGQPNEIEKLKNEHAMFQKKYAFASLTEFKDADATLEWLWKTWLRRWEDRIGGEDYGIDLYLLQKADEDPTKTWISLAESFNKKKTLATLRMWIGGSSEGTKYFESFSGSSQKKSRLVFDRHARLAKKLSTIDMDAGCRYVILDKANTDFDKLFRPSLARPWLFPYQIMEAGLLNLLVIDERIANQAMTHFDIEGDSTAVSRILLENENHKPMQWHAASKAGMFVVTHFTVKGIANGKEKPIELLLCPEKWSKAKKEGLSCPKLEFTLDFTKDDPKSSISLSTDDPGHGNGRFRVEPDKIDMVLIHQGVLDSVYDRTQEDPQNLQNRIVEHIKQQFPWLVLESGRGIPPMIRDPQMKKEKFVPFSILERSFRNGRVGKLGLSQTLMELTRRG